MDIIEKRLLATNWFTELRDKICNEFTQIEQEYSSDNAANFSFKKWQRPGGGGGIMGMMKGKVFEKVGVNISTVYGEFSEEAQKKIPGCENNPNFWASGISLVAHMHSPLVPAIHLNTRFINTTKNWFGGGTDLNPAILNKTDVKEFHDKLKKCCDKFDKDYYPKYKKWGDEYFFIKHRNVARGAGGIFYDYLDSDNFSADFAFTQEVGKSFLEIYPKLVRKHMFEPFTEQQKELQLIKRGLYAEFNLLYDRGTKFGLMTEGNVEAILMSLPPLAKWT